MGRLDTIVVHIETLDVPPINYAVYSTDSDCRALFQQWLNGLWAEKDALIQNTIDKYAKRSKASANKLSMPMSASHDDLTKSGF